MASRIEQIIDEIEDYIRQCKPQAFSSSKIVVNRETMDSLLAELRAKAPEEIRRYQRIISNKEAILADAQTKAEDMIANAQVQKDSLISEHQIMQQAYSQANEIIENANQQAQEILENASRKAQETIDEATNMGNAYRMSAAQYMDDMLRNLESCVSHAADAARVQSEAYIGTMQGFFEQIASNRAELGLPERPEQTDTEELPTEEELPNVDISSSGEMD